MRFFFIALALTLTSTSGLAYAQSVANIPRPRVAADGDQIAKPGCVVGKPVLDLALTYIRTADGSAVSAVAATAEDKTTYWTVRLSANVPLHQDSRALAFTSCQDTQ